jgi:hypothetical protein
MVPLETITIEHPDTPGERMIINKADFNPEIHKPYESPTDDQSAADTESPKPKGRPRKNAEE